MRKSAKKRLVVRISAGNGLRGGGGGGVQAYRFGKNDFELGVGGEGQDFYLGL